MSEENLDRYAQILIEHAIALRPHQRLDVWCEQDHRDFALRVGEAAYRAGSSLVRYRSVDPNEVLQLVRSAGPEQIARYHLENQAWLVEALRGGGALLVLRGAPDPARLEERLRINARNQRFYAAEAFVVGLEISRRGVDQRLLAVCTAPVPTRPWARRVFPDLAEEEAFGFTGHERDDNGADTVGDLDDMHSRFCSPTLGRFLSFDPIGGNPRNPQTWNRYAYALNNPLNFVDPFGLTPVGTVYDETFVYAFPPRGGAIKVPVWLFDNFFVDAARHWFKRPSAILYVPLLHETQGTFRMVGGSMIRRRLTTAGEVATLSEMSEREISCRFQIERIEPGGRRRIDHQSRPQRADIFSQYRSASARFLRGCRSISRRLFASQSADTRGRRFFPEWRRGSARNERDRRRLRGP